MTLQELEKLVAAKCNQISWTDGLLTNSN